MDLMMGQKAGNKNGSVGSPNGPAATESRLRGRRLTHAELSARLLESAAGGSALVEEPVDSGLWPTAGLTPEQINLLGKRLDATAPGAKKPKK